MEPVQVATQMETLVQAIKLEGQKSTPLITDKAMTMMEYDKAIAVSEATFKVGGMAVTLIKSQAKGSCAEELCAMIIAQDSLKAHWCRLDYLKAQLNAFQSINRHLQ